MSKDLEFVLRFKNEARQVLQQARQDLKGLGQEAAIVGTQLRQMSGAGSAVNAAMMQTATGAQKAEIAQKKLEIQQARLELQSQKLVQQQTGLTLAQQRLTLQSERLAMAQQRLDQQKGKLNTTTKGLVGSFAVLARQFLPLTAAASAFAAIKLNDEFVLLRARVQNATQTSEEFKQAWGGIIDISRNTGASLEGTVSVFQRLSFVRKEINATTTEMLQFTDTVSKLGIISGATPDALKFGLTQLGQSLSNQIVRAEEFNSIMENIPAVGKQIADELGVSTGELRNLVIEGKVLSADVFAAMLNATEKVNAEFNKFPNTVGRAFQGFLIDLQAAIGGLFDATNASEILIQVIYRVGKALKGVADLLRGFIYVFKAAFTSLIGDIVGVAAKGLQIVQDTVNGVIKGINLLRKDKIQPIELTVDPKLLEQATNEEVKKNLKDAGDAFKSAVENIGGEAFGIDVLKAEKIDKAAASVRKISQDYGQLAKQLQTKGDKKGEKQKETFLNDVNNRIEAMKEEMKWIGKSSKERERATMILKLQQDAIKAGLKDFDPSEYIAAYDALHAAQEKVHTDFMTGWKAAMQDFAENAKGLGDLAQDVFKQASDGISSTISGLVDGSINSFSSLREAVGGILKDLAGTIARFVIQQQILMPLLGMFGFGGDSSSAGLNFGPGGSTYLLSAQGNAFTQGMPVKYFAKGGILNGPTAFPMQNGTAIGGEAGSEGLLPLKRLSNGDLGVQVDGSGSGSTTQLNYSPVFSISLEGSGGGNGDGDKQVATQLSKILDDEGRKMVLRVITEQQRPGGILAGGRGKTA
jgi:lambda family phage tail tape measure protein